MYRLAKPGDKKTDYKFLDELFGIHVSRAKSYKKLLDYPQRVLKERAEVLAKLFTAKKWQNHPLILVLLPKTVFQRAKILEKGLGKEWKNYPRLLLLRPERFVERLKLLGKLFDVPDEWFTNHFWFFTISEKKLMNAYHKVITERKEAVSHPGLVMKYIQYKRVPEDARSRKHW